MSFYNKIYQGDCKDVMLELPEESVDLVYLDPPFFSNKHYEMIWNDGSEEDQFKERWKGGIQTFIGWMKLRMQLVKRVMRDNGSVYLHCDYRAVHYLKEMMDEIFEPKNFRNEIIWGFRTGGAGSRAWANKHNNILFYTKSDKYYFKTQKEVYYISYSKEKGMHPYFVGYPALTEDFDRDNVKIPPNVKRAKTIMRDVWVDEEVKPLWNMGFSGEERIPDPNGKKGTFVRTQKPENLVKRIMLTSARKGAVVMDPFSGTGTTLSAGHKLGLKWVGIDISPTACKVMQTRLKSLGYKTNITEILPKRRMEKKIDRSRLGFDWQDFVCDGLGWTVTKHRSDGGIDAIYFNAKGEQCYGQIKLGPTGRPKIDEFGGVMDKMDCKEGIFVADSFPKSAYAAAELFKKRGKSITLITKEEVFRKIFK